MTKTEIKNNRFFGIPKLLPYLKPYRANLFRLVLFAALGGVCEIIFPLFQKYAIDNFVYQADSLSSIKNAVIWFTIIYTIVLVAYSIFNVISSYAACELEMYTSRDLKNAAFNHLQTLSASYYNSHNVGYIHARVMSDTGRISVVLSWIFIDIIWCITYVIGALVSMFLLNVPLALCVAVIVPIAVFISLFFKKRLTDIYHKVREANSVVTGKLNEGITGAKTAKSLVIEDLMQHKFEKSSDYMMKTSVKMAHWRSLYVSVFSLISSTAFALVLWRGGIITQSGVMIVGTLSVFLSYVIDLIDRLNNLVGTISNMINSQVNIERFTNLMDTETEVKDRPDVIAKYGSIFEPKRENWEPLHGDIEFENVTFCYPDGNENVLENFSLKIPQGTNCAIVGETGAGKSTLVNLVCRFFEPTSGRVLIDGKDIRDRSLSWLHSNIGYVLQSPHLFTGSIKENLMYGNENATQEEMEAAVRSVAAEGIIERMNGYDAQVGEGGDLLSTGEKQLLSFARALICDPRIFILDEATSSIDTVTEQKIQNAIAVAMNGRTSLVIAHRLSTIRQADIILVVKDGKIVERGTHDQLMARHGYYFELYIRQFRDEAMQQSLS